MEKTVQFSNYKEQSLQAGVYHIHAEQTLAPSCKIEGYHIDSTDLNIAIVGDQIAINENEIYSCYPPKDSSGNFSSCLPHIVLQRPTLPWERSLEMEQSDSPLPFVALLVVAETEGAVLQTVTFEQSKQVPVNVYVPHVDESLLKSDMTCQVVDMPISLLLDILPTKEDLPFLAHTRGVDLDNKVTDSQVKGEWFSCVVANRYPESLTDKEVPLLHTAYLISLEGLEHILKLSPEQRNVTSFGYDFVRMYALYHYSFRVEQEPYDFKSLGESLKANVYQKDIELVQSEKLKEKLFYGYVPIQQHFRDGSDAVSWYRSPFLIGKPNTKHQVEYYFCADQLLEYDPAIGMFDITYSAAWQIGRMIAIRNKELATDIFHWRLKKKNQAVKRQTDIMLRGMITEGVVQDKEVNVESESININCKQTWNRLLEELLSLEEMSEEVKEIGLNNEEEHRKEDE